MVSKSISGDQYNIVPNAESWSASHPHILAILPVHGTDLHRTLYVEANPAAEDDKTKSPLCLRSTTSSAGLPQQELFAPSEHWAKLKELPASNFHIIISTGSGTGLAPEVYQCLLAPLFRDFDLTPTVHTTTSASSITDLTKSMFLPAALDGIKQCIILLSGDGGVLDVLGTLLSSVTPLPSTYCAPTLIVLPLGTGNALANSSARVSENDPRNSDETLNVRSMFLGRPKPLPFFRATFSPGSRILSNEGQTESPLHQDSNGDHVSHGAVVLSWGFHATLVADSDTPDYRKHGASRFQLVAKELLYPAEGSAPHAYHGKVSILRPGQPKWEVLREGKDEHAYILATMVSNLEATFRISPKSRPLDGKLWIVHFGSMSGDEIMAVMTQAYDGGKHVTDERVGYEEIDGVRIEFAEEDERWRRVCVDGQIVRVEEGGWVEVKKGTPGALELVSCYEEDKTPG